MLDSPSYSGSRTDVAIKTLYLFRHGETDYNKAGRFQGQLDIPLNMTGREQAQRLGSLLRAEQLEGRGLEVIVTSDLARARETADLVAEQLGGIPVIVDEGLRESCVGQAQGLTRDEIEAKFGADLLGAWSAFSVESAKVGFPGGETGEEVYLRSLAAIEAIVASCPQRIIGIATHGGVIRRLLQRLLGEHAPGGIRVGNTAIIKLSYDPQSAQFKRA